MENQLVLLERVAQGIACLTLNRPEKRNALNLALLNELNHHLQHLASEPQERVIILQGAGNIFCAGMDLQEARDPELSPAISEAIRQTLTLLHQLPLISIAAVHGIAAGGGAGLLMACDLALATPETKIGFPETHRGLVAAQVTPFLLRQVALRDARELLLTGHLVDAERALQMRLVNQVTALADLMPLAFHLAEEILQGAPEAVRATKRLLAALAPVSLEEEMNVARGFLDNTMASHEAQEGMQAFLEKRTPKWDLP